MKFAFTILLLIVIASKISVDAQQYDQRERQNSYDRYDSRQERNYDRYESREDRNYDRQDRGYDRGYERGYDKPQRDYDRYDDKYSRDSNYDRQGYDKQSDYERQKEKIRNLKEEYPQDFFGCKDKCADLKGKSKYDFQLCQHKCLDEDCYFKNFGNNTKFEHIEDQRRHLQESEEELKSVLVNYIRSYLNCVNVKKSQWEIERAKEL